VSRQFQVTVPCSTSNLGAGFDCVGLALNRYITATMEPGGDQLHVVRKGTLVELPDAGDDIVARLLRSRNIYGKLTIDSTIPIGKGLGSSAAAAVAGLALAALVNDKNFDVDVALDAATALEGHPDNAAPSIVGGLVAVITDGMRHRSIRLKLSDKIGFVFAAPHSSVSTKAARNALPSQVLHSDATRTIARSVALIEGLADGDPELLRIGFSDDLHVPYRIGMIPGGGHALSAALEAGAWAATISGSGSGLIAACERGSEEHIVAAMASAFESATAHPALALVMQPDFEGVRTEKSA
jgi:homoserine kinase